MDVVQKFLRNNDLMLLLVSFLETEDVLTLYAISKPFHYLVGSNYHQYISQRIRTFSAQAPQVFSVTYYPELYVKNPAFIRTAEEEANGIYDTPSLRFVSMVTGRYRAIDEMVFTLAKDGLRLPRNGRDAIARIWALLDQQTSASRKQMVADRTVWADEDLYTALLFIMKLDMKFTDPIDGNGQETGFRKMLLSQRTLTWLHKAINATFPTSQIELLQMYIRTYHEPSDEAIESAGTIFGVPMNEVGRMQFENRGQGSIKLLRPDEVIIQECHERGIDMTAELIELMRYGFVDEDTFRNIR